MMAAPSARYPSMSPSVCRTNTIVAAMAPGPANSGVPKGTKATLTSSAASGCELPLPVSRSSATSSNSNPPAPCNAWMPMPR